MNFKLINAYINKRIIKICLKQREIRWLKEEKKLRKRKKLKKEEEEEDKSLFFENALFNMINKKGVFLLFVSKLSSS